MFTHSQKRTEYNTSQKRGPEAFSLPTTVFVPVHTPYRTYNTCLVIIMPPSRPAPDLSPSVRRNLFSGHISRRPASGEMDQQQQPPPQQRQPQGPRRLHQRSVSTPSLSPSPARSSPFTANINDSPPPTNQTNPLFSQHALLPSPPVHASLHDSYDPTISPNRPLSPRSSAAIFPNSSIVALNPLTGRPALPHIPVLPGRLRLTDSDDDDDEEAPQIEDLTSHHRQGQNISQSDPYGAAAAAAATHPQNGGGAVDYVSHMDEEHEERAAFERDLRDRLASHRARLQRQQQQQATAHGAAVVSVSNNQHSQSSRLGRRTHRVKLVSQRDDGPDFEMGSGGYRGQQQHQHQGEHAAPPSYTTRDYDRDEEEKDQAAEKGALLSMLITKLREEVARAEDEAWMFGDTGAFRTGSSDDTGYE